MTEVPSEDGPRCSVWCRCPGLHWRLEGDGWVWRPGQAGCVHPRHDAAGVAVWGIATADLADPVVWGLSGARGWFWCVLRGGRLAERGWSDTARWAVGTVEGVACGMAKGHPVRGPHAVRCDLVAAEGWRLLVRREAGEVPGAA